MGLLVAPAELTIGFAMPVLAHNKDAIALRYLIRRSDEDEYKLNLTIV